ncbi:MAG: hypothetical protein ACK47B_04235 [Armatimonadota bacterium]
MGVLAAMISTTLFSPTGLLIQAGEAPALVSWFRFGRGLPTAAYSHLIRNYGLLSVDERLQAEQVVKELLTPEELTFLRDTLRTTVGMEILDGRIPLPFEPVNRVLTRQHGRTVFIEPFTWRIDRGDCGMIRLKEFTGCPDPFDIRGCIQQAEIQRSSSPKGRRGRGK